MEFSSDNIKTIDKVKSDRKNNCIKIHIITKDNKRCCFIVDYDKYCDWLNKNKEKYNDIFIDFISEFINSSKEEEKELSEIIDKYGNIMPDDDKPSNATNREVGDYIKIDTDKAYYQGVPKRYRYYSGGYGTGVVTW